MGSRSLRAILIRLQNHLSDGDRNRLYFFLGRDISQRIQDDTILDATFNLIRNLFEQDRINKQDLLDLIEAFDAIGCQDAAQMLRDHMRRMQTSGRYESTLSLTSILPPSQEDEKLTISCDYPVRNYTANDYSNKDITIHSDDMDINPVEIESSQHRANSHSKKQWKVSNKIYKYSLLMAVLMIIGLTVGIVVYKMKNDQLGKNFHRINKSMKQLRKKVSYLPINVRWNPNGSTVAGGNGQGSGLNQFSFHSHMDVDDDDQTVYIADRLNHRVMEWKKGATEGRVVAGGNGNGNRDDQLNSPGDVIIDYYNDALIIADSLNRRIVRWPRQNGQRGETIISNVTCSILAMDRRGHLYILDENQSEVKRWKIGGEEGTVVAGGNGNGHRPDQLDHPRYIFVDGNESVYVSDSNNHRVMKWVKGAKQGIVVAGGHGPGNSSRQLRNPEGIFVDRFGTIYVADKRNARVMRWMKGSAIGEFVVGRNRSIRPIIQSSLPTDLAFDKDNNLYVFRTLNARVERFEMIA